MYSQSALKNLCSRDSTPTWTSSCQSISLDSARETPPHTSSLDWCTGLPLQATKVTPPLPASTTYQKPLTGYGTKDFSPNCTTSEFVVMPWITDYLSDRRQCVRLRNSTSPWLPVPAGVPQGSVLGPLLFLAYTIDLPNCVRHPSQCDQFADDTALTTVSSSPGVCEEHLQQSVTATSTWLSNWRLAVNVEKTVTMAFTRSPFPSEVSINLNGNALSTVNEHRHLGLTLSSDLRWSAHIDKICQKQDAYSTPSYVFGARSHGKPLFSTTLSTSDQWWSMPA